MTQQKRRSQPASVVRHLLCSRLDGHGSLNTCMAACTFQGSNFSFKALDARQLLRFKQRSVSGSLLLRARLARGTHAESGLPIRQRLRSLWTTQNPLQQTTSPRTACNRSMAHIRSAQQGKRTRSESELVGYVKTTWVSSNHYIRPISAERCVNADEYKLLDWFGGGLKPARAGLCLNH